MELPVRRQQYRRPQVHHLLHRIVMRHLRHGGVQRSNGLTQALDQQHLPVVAALGCGPIGCQIRPVAVLVAHVCEPAQGLLFELVFGHAGASGA